MVAGYPGTPVPAYTHPGAWCGVLAGDPCRVVCYAGERGESAPAGTKWVFGATPGYHTLGPPDNFAQLVGSFPCPPQCCGVAGGGQPPSGPPVDEPVVPEEGEDIPTSDYPVDDPVQGPGPGPLPPGPIPLPDPFPEPVPPQGGGEYSDFPFASLDPWDWPGGSGHGSPGGQEPMPASGAGAVFLPDVTPTDTDRLGEGALSPQG